MNGTHKLCLGASLLFALALSCGEEEEDKKPVPPPGPAALTINAFIGAAAQRFSRDEADAIELDCSGLLAVELSESNWTFRPPGNCGATPQCGHVAVWVDDIVIEAASRTVLVPLGDTAAGAHRVRAELRLGDHTAFIGDAGTAVADELDITVTVLPCPEPGAGGGGGEAGAAPAGGNGGSAGAAAGAAGAGGIGGVAGVGGEAGSSAGAGGQGGSEITAGAGGASAGGGGI